MKSDTIIIMGAAAAGLGLVYAMTRPKGTQAGMGYVTPSTGGTAQQLNNNGTVQIPNTALPGQPGWAWQNFTDGTSISPEGDYYMNGQLVWKNPS